MQRKFGHLTVLRIDPIRGERSAIFWFCRCDCGEEVRVRGVFLRNGTKTSCGCVRTVKHGHTSKGHHSPTYSSWSRMLQRCTNPNISCWPLYGGANPPVTASDRWNPTKGGSFENFLADLGERPENTTLGRYLDTGSYQLGNCSWQSAKEQAAERMGKHAMLLWRSARQSTV